MAKWCCSAEAGVGKSRLVAALRERLLGESHAELRYFCSPHRRQRALPRHRPARADGRFRARRRAQGEGREAGGAFRRCIGGRPEAGGLLSLPADRFPAVPLSPAAKRERTLAAVLRQLERFSRQAPLLVVFEDTHWIDPSSLEFLHLAVD